MLQTSLLSIDVSVKANAAMHCALVLDQVYCIPINVIQEGSVKIGKQLYLSKKDIEIVQNGWLTDNHMLLANCILKREYPEVNGLQDTVFQQNYSWKVPTSEFVQFLHVEGSHWITISNIGEKENCVYLYDSLYNGVSQATKELNGNYVNKDKVKINVINVQQQENGSDCGVFATAYAQCLFEGNNPAEYDFIVPRKHLANYLPKGSLPRFPKVLAEHLPVILHKEVYFQLKPVEMSLSDYEEDILCLL